jgi:phage terminase large subunit-like protein
MKLPAFEGEWNTGKLLFPSRLSWKTLKKLKDQQGSYHFSAQYMLNPVPEESATFRGEFKYYDETDIRGLQLNKFITIDPAVSESKNADFSAMVCVGVDANNDWYLLDIWREQCQPSRLIDQIFFWDTKWKPISVGIETTAFQKTLRYFIYDSMKQKNHFLPLKELTHTDQSKDQRIKGLQPRYETASVFHNKYIPFMDYLEDELKRFPKGKNDDIVDALASQLELAFPPKSHEERKNHKRGSVYPA